MYKVTIIIAIYNHEKFLKRCLESVAMQKTNFRFKALLLDDASTDNSTQIVKEYSEKYPEIFEPVIREKNLGVVDNVYEALTNRLEGEYQASLEGDDFWTDETKLQQQVDALDKHPDIDFCGHQTSIHFVDQNIEDDITIKNKYQNEVTVIKGLKNLIRPHTCSRMYRIKYDYRKIKDKAAVVFDTGIYWFYLLQNPKMLYIKNNMATYNVHNKGMFSGASKKERRLLSTQQVLNLHNATQRKYKLFTFKRFIKAIPRNQRINFILNFIFKNEKAYEETIKKIQKP